MPPADEYGFESELTDLEDDEDEDLDPSGDERPLAHTVRSSTSTTSATVVSKKSSKKSKGKAECTPFVRFGRPCNLNQGVAWINRELSKGRIDVSPDYQRDVVWNDAKQCNLINSLMENYYIPAVVFAVNGKQRICIDGKQRLTSIQRFMQGYIPYRNSQTKEKLWYQNLPGKRGKLMSAELKDHFETQQLMCSEYQNLTLHDQRELFQRVQLGMPLSPAERLKSINGPNAELVRDMSTRVPARLRQYLPWEKKGRDFLSLARIAYIIIADKRSPEEPTVTKVETFLQANDTNLRHRSTILSVIDTLCHLLNNKEWRKPFCGTGNIISRVEFVMTCWLIHQHREKLSLARLSAAIREMTLQVRPGTDGKEGKKFFKALADFVSKKVSHLDFAGIKGGVPAADVVHGPPPEPEETCVSPRTRAIGSKKRSRFRVESDTDNETQEEAPLRSQEPKRTKLTKGVTRQPDGDSHPLKAKQRAKAEGGVKGIKKVGVTGSTTKKSVATTTVKRPVASSAPASASTSALKGGSDIASVDNMMTNRTCIRKPAISPTTSRASSLQVGAPSVQPGSKMTSATTSVSTSSVHSGVTQDRSTGQQARDASRQLTTPRRPESALPTPPLSGGRSRVLPQSAASPGLEVSRPLASSLTQLGGAPQNLTSELKTEDNSPVFGAPSGRLAAIHEAKAQVSRTNHFATSTRTSDGDSSGGRNRDLRTRQISATPSFSPAVQRSGPVTSLSGDEAFIDREMIQMDSDAQLRMDVDQLEVALFGPTGGSSSVLHTHMTPPVTTPLRGRSLAPGESGNGNGNGERLENARPIMRRSELRSSHLFQRRWVPPPQRSVGPANLCVDTNVDRGLPTAQPAVQAQNSGSAVDSSSFTVPQSPQSAVPASGTMDPSSARSPAPLVSTSSAGSSGCRDDVRRSVN